MQALHSQADSLVRMGEQSLQALHHHEDGNKSKQTLKHDRKWVPYSDKELIKPWEFASWLRKQ